MAIDKMKNMTIRLNEEKTTLLKSNERVYQGL